MKKYLAILILASLVAGCGGSGYGGSSGTVGGSTGSSGSVADTFTNAVAILVAMMSDDGSPASVDSYTTTAPEDTSPGQVM